MRSSSRAMSIGDVRHSSAMSSYCPWRTGCSMECMPNCDRRSRRSDAFSGVKLPLASSRISSSSGVNCRRTARMRLSSSSKSMPPIFSFSTLNPCCSLAAMACRMVCLSAIHIRPLIAIPLWPRVHVLSGSGMFSMSAAHRTAEDVTLPYGSVPSQYALSWARKSARDSGASDSKKLASA